MFTTITGAAATNCFGVKGMAQRSMTDGLVHLLRPEAMSKGVKVTYNDDGTVSIELHIIVENGVNLASGLPLHHERGHAMWSTSTPASTVKAVDVCVDSVTAVTRHGRRTDDDRKDQRRRRSSRWSPSAPPASPRRSRPSTT